MKIDILFQNDDFIAVDKHPGVTVIPERFNNEQVSLNKMAEIAIGQKLWVVHRLDRDTSGVVIFAKNEAAHKHVSLQFQEHTVGKFYVGLVHGRMEQKSGRIETPIVEHPTIKGKMTVAKKGKLSVTDFNVVEEWPLHTLLQYQIHTGRTHQIRVHSHYLGHAIVCDNLYGNGTPFLLSQIKKNYKLSNNELEEKPLLARLALHAYKCIFLDMQGNEIIVESPLPKDINACIKQLDKQYKTTKHA
jgi:23S rRNA pseudouridine1911/1915/1917 synthase